MRFQAATARSKQEAAKSKKEADTLAQAARAQAEKARAQLASLQDRVKPCPTITGHTEASDGVVRFKIRTTDTRGRDATVRRRFTEFKVLHQTIVRRDVAPPPFPRQGWTAYGVNKNPARLQKRQLALGHFLAVASQDGRVSAMSEWREFLDLS